MHRFIIAAAACAMLAGCNIGREHVLTQSERMTAEIGARRFGEATGEKFAGCYPRDHNGNGLVTCSLRDNRTSITYELLCGYDESKIGCKRKEP